MSKASTEATDDDLRERITLFVQSQFPQIKMHGGDHSISELDAESGEVSIRLSGACSGCGISPMTVQALQKRLRDEFDEINTVHAQTGSENGGLSPSFPGETKEDNNPAPF
jgi:Fe-S cluster biogenesis protein NfuA